jgi:nicotinamidase-related amidase
MRVWDEFLSERDKQHLALGWQKTEPFGLGARGALLVIDNWDQIVGPRRESVLEAAEDSPTRCGTEGWDAIALTKELLAHARGRGMKVVHTTISDPVERGSHLRASHRGPYPFHPDTAPMPGELVITKSYASAFFGTALAGHLVTRGIDTVLACGNSTSGCVRASVVDGAQCGFRMAVIEECTFDRTQASHAMSLFDIDQKYGDVISYAQAVEYIEHQLVVAPSGDLTPR